MYILSDQAMGVVTSLAISYKLVTITNLTK